MDSHADAESSRPSEAQAINSDVDLSLVRFQRGFAWTWPGGLCMPPFAGMFIRKGFLRQLTWHPKPESPGLPVRKPFQAHPCPCCIRGPTKIPRVSRCGRNLAHWGPQLLGPKVSNQTPNIQKLKAAPEDVLTHGYCLSQDRSSSPPKP